MNQQINGGDLDAHITRIPEPTRAECERHEEATEAADAACDDWLRCYQSEIAMLYLRYEKDCQTAFYNVAGYFPERDDMPICGIVDLYSEMLGACKNNPEGILK